MTWSTVSNHPDFPASRCCGCSIYGKRSQQPLGVALDWTDNCNLSLNELKSRLPFGSNEKLTIPHDRGQFTEDAGSTVKNLEIIFTSNFRQSGHYAAAAQKTRGKLFALKSVCPVASQCVLTPAQGHSTTTPGIVCGLGLLSSKRTLLARDRYSF